MVVREKAMERYGIDMTTKATELLYARNGMSTAEKFEAIQSLFTRSAITREPAKEPVFAIP
jgi:replicative DNA helicase